MFNLALNSNLFLLIPGLLVFIALVIHCFLFRGLRLTLTFFGSAFLCVLMREITLKLMNRFYGKLPYEFIGYPIRVFQFPVAVFMGWALTFYLSWCLAERILKRFGFFTDRIFPTVVWSVLVTASIAYCVETTALMAGWWHWMSFDGRFREYLVAPFNIFLVWPGFTAYFLTIFFLLECSRHRRQWWRVFLCFAIIDIIIGTIFLCLKDFNPAACIYETIRLLLPICLMFFYNIDFKYGSMKGIKFSRYPATLIKPVPIFAFSLILIVASTIGIIVFKKTYALYAILPAVLFLLISIKKVPIVLIFITVVMAMVSGDKKAFILSIPLFFFFGFWIYSVLHTKDAGKLNDIKETTR